MLDKNSPFAISTRPRREESLSSLALTLLGDAIVAGDPAPGALVSEVELNQRFAVGLAATRSALARFAATGWVAAEGRKGWRVLPMSAEHLADLRAARDCLEPALAGQLPPAPLRAELTQRADIHQGSLVNLTPAALFHQEREILALCARTMAAPRLRAWLADTWDLSMRADRFLDLRFGIDRPPLPVVDLARSLAQGDARGAATLLHDMRRDFADRCARALSRSEVQIAPVSARQAAPRPADVRTAAADPSKQQSPPQQGDQT